MTTHFTAVMGGGGGVGPYRKFDPWSHPKACNPTFPIDINPHLLGFIFLYISRGPLRTCVVAFAGLVSSAILPPPPLHSNCVHTEVVTQTTTPLPVWRKYFHRVSFIPTTKILVSTCHPVLINSGTEELRVICGLVRVGGAGMSTHRNEHLGQVRHPLKLKRIFLTPLQSGQDGRLIPKFW